MAERDPPGNATAVLGVGLCVVVIGAAIVIPWLLPLRTTGHNGNETSAIATLHAIVMAQKTYASTCGGGGFAESLTVLGRPARDGEAAFLDQSLIGTNMLQLNGYAVTMAAGAGATAGPADCHGLPTVTAFYAAAVPVIYNETGTRSFAVNSSNVVWMIAGAAAPTEPFGAPAMPVQ